MKKAKIMLTSIAVFAVVAAGLAFKTKISNPTLYISTVTGTTGSPEVSLTTDGSAPNTFIGSFYITTKATDNVGTTLIPLYSNGSLK